MTTRSHTLFHRLMLFSCALLLITACARGHRLDTGLINQIQPNITSEQQIRAMFGEPVSVSINRASDTKILTYGYRNSDDIKKVAAGLGGGAAGGYLGSQIGKGRGSAIAGSVGAIAGALIAENLVTARQEQQFLEIFISRSTGRVIDFNYNENKSRSQSWHPSSGVSPL